MLTIDMMRKAVLPLAEKYGIVKVDLFGSYAAGTATSRSDADFLITFKKTPPSIFKVMGFRQELADSLAHPVDVVTVPIKRRDMLNVKEVITIYERT